MKRILTVFCLLLGACSDGPDMRDAFDGSYVLSRFNSQPLPAIVGEQLTGDTLYITSGTLEVQNRRYTISIRWRIDQQFETGWAELGGVILQNGVARLDPDTPGQSNRIIVQLDSIIRISDSDHGYDFDFR